MPFTIAGRKDGYTIEYPQVAEVALLEAITRSGVPYRFAREPHLGAALNVAQARPYCPRLSHLPADKRELIKGEWLAQWEDALRRVDILMRHQTPHEVLWAMISPWTWKSVQLLSHDVGGLGRTLAESQSEPLRIIGEGLLCCAESPSDEEPLEHVMPPQYEPETYTIHDNIPRD